MGAKLLEYFDKAQKKGGIMAKVKLAAATKMSSEDAEKVEDSEQNIKIFEEAFAKI